MKRSQSRPREPGMPCPHCKSRTIVRNSLQVSDLVRETRHQCDNDDCGHSFVVQMSVIRTIRPSDTPNPNVHLPLGSWRPKPANDDMPLPANDDRPAAADAAAPTAPPPLIMTG